jgi:hypothetical protein
MRQATELRSNPTISSLAWICLIASAHEGAMAAID